MGEYPNSKDENEAFIAFRYPPKKTPSGASTCARRLAVPGHGDPGLEQGFFTQRFDADFHARDRTGPVDLGEKRLLAGASEIVLSISRLPSVGFGSCPNFLGSQSEISADETWPGVQDGMPGSSLNV